MDVVAGSIVSSAESAVITIYNAIIDFLKKFADNASEGFKDSSNKQIAATGAAMRVKNQIGYPVDDLFHEEAGMGGDDVYSQYSPYLNKRESSSRLQHDNHRWPTSREMAGSFEQTLRKDMVLPCNFPSPAPLKGHSGYAAFV